LSAAQAEACAFLGKQAPFASQKSFPLQYMSEAQLVGHAPLIPSQRYGAHDGTLADGGRGEQVPEEHDSQLPAQALLQQ
jgi:hypothetical protein